MVFGTIDDVEALVKIIALVAAAGFFLYKLMTGWLLINLEIELDTKRVSDPSSEGELLGVTVILKKGRTDTLWLRHLDVRVRCQDSSEKEVCTYKQLGLKAQEELVTNVETKKISFGKWQVEKMVVNWEQVKETKVISLSPGEKAQFATFVPIPKGCVCLVDAVLLGDRTFWRFNRKGNGWGFSGEPRRFPSPKLRTLTRDKQVQYSPQTAHTTQSQPRNGGDIWMEPFALALGPESKAFEPWRNLFFSKTSKILLIEGETDVEYFKMLRELAHGKNRLYIAETG